jgi:hypothetical protein
MWSTVTPAGMDNADIRDWDFLDAGHAWLAYDRRSVPNEVPLVSTSDGGRHWCRVGLSPTSSTRPPTGVRPGRRSSCRHPPVPAGRDWSPSFCRSERAPGSPSAATGPTGPPSCTAPATTGGPGRPSPPRAAPMSAISLKSPTQWRLIDGRRILATDNAGATWHTVRAGITLTLTDESRALPATTTFVTPTIAGTSPAAKSKRSVGPPTVAAPGRRSPSPGDQPACLSSTWRSRTA